MPYSFLYCCSMYSHKSATGMGNSCACGTDYGDINSSDNDHAHAPPVHHPSVAARLASVHALTSRLPIAKPNVSSSPRLPLSPPSVVHEQIRSPDTAVFTSVAPSSHAASTKTNTRTGSPRSRRRVVPPKNSPRIVPSAFHSVMPAPLVIREESDPMVGIRALHLFGSQQLQQISSLPTPTVVVHEAEGTAGGRDEEAALLLSPFQLRRIEVEGQRRQDYLNYSDRQYESTSRSQSECPPGDEFAEALDAFA